MRGNSWRQLCRHNSEQGAYTPTHSQTHTHTHSHRTCKLNSMQGSSEVTGDDTVLSSFLFSLL
jgi:hypothetical protein